MAVLFVSTVQMMPVKMCCVVNVVEVYALVKVVKITTVQVVILIPTIINSFAQMKIIIMESKEVCGVNRVHKLQQLNKM